MSNAPRLDRSAVDRLCRIGGATLAISMLELYLTEAPARVAAAESGAGNGDAQAVARAAHSLRSSAGNVGAMRLLETAEALEMRAASGPVEMAAVRQLRDEFQASETAVRRLLEELRT